MIGLVNFIPRAAISAVINDASAAATVVENDSSSTHIRKFCTDLVLQYYITVLVFVFCYCGYLIAFARHASQGR